MEETHQRIARIGRVSLAGKRMEPKTSNGINRWGPRTSVVLRARPAVRGTQMHARGFGDFRVQLLWKQK